MEIAAFLTVAGLVLWVGLYLLGRCLEIAALLFVVACSYGFVGLVVYAVAWTVAFPVTLTLHVIVGLAWGVYCLCSAVNETRAALARKLTPRRA